MQAKGTSLEQPRTPSHLRVLRLPTVCEGPGLLGTKAILLCRVFEAFSLTLMSIFGFLTRHSLHFPPHDVTSEQV